MSWLASAVTLPEKCKQMNGIGQVSALTGVRCVFLVHRA